MDRSVLNRLTKIVDRLEYRGLAPRHRSGLLHLHQQHRFALFVAGECRHSVRMTGGCLSAPLADDGGGIPLAWSRNVATGPVKGLLSLCS